MTYKEKWELEHPDEIFTTDDRCPKDSDGYEIKCHESYICSRCWNQEIPEEKTNTEQPDDPVIVYSAGPLTKIDNSEPEIPTIKDSGSTTEFETGAHRDARGGKGRCDLLPLEVVANFICDSNDDTDYVLWNLREFQKTNSTSYLYSALEHFNVQCWDNCYTMMLEVAKHYEEGGKKYGDNNWKRGMPAHIYIDSAIRHYLKWLRGDKDENHDLAFCWNIMCCIWEVGFHKESEETK